MQKINLRRKMCFPAKLDITEPSLEYNSNNKFNLWGLEWVVDRKREQALGNKSQWQKLYHLTEESSMGHAQTRNEII
jgi:hypothetical protein